jgi:flagellar hook-length control protein FliK
VSQAAPDALTALQGNSGKAKDAGKAGDAEKFTLKAATSQGEVKPEGKAEAKPQTHEADKDLIAAARGEATAKDARAGASSPAADANAAAPKADAAAPQILTAPAHAATAHAAAAAAAPQPAAPAAAIPLAHVAIEITNKALSGKNHFEIRLDPPELGRIEVRLDVDRDGNVTSRMIADRPDTLDLLRRDAAGLERALNDAGLKTSDNGLQFSLRDNSAGQQQAQGRADATLVVEDETLTANEAALLDYSRLAGQRGGLDIRV